MSEGHVNNTSEISAGGHPANQEKLSLGVLPQVLPIAVLIILTNALVFCLFCTKTSLRKGSNYLLFSLAMCDFLNGSINIPLFILLYIPVVKGPMFLTLACTLEVSHNFVAIAAAAHILLITAEKYVAVMRPLKHHVIKKKTMLVIMAGTWLSSAIISSVPIIWFTKRIHFVPPALVLESAFNVFVIVAVFFVPYAFISYAQVIMFQEVFKRNRQRLSLTNNRCSKRKRKRNSERKCVVIFATMAVTFAVCWMPWFVLRLIYSLAGQGLISPDHVATETAAQVILIVRYLASAINPLLYTFFKQDFWRALKELIPRKSVTDYRSSSWASGKASRRSMGRTIRGNQSDSIDDPVLRSGKRNGSRRSIRAV